MTQVNFLEDVNDAYGALRDDPSRCDLLARVDAALDQLEHDPGDRSVRRRRFENTLGGVWLVEIRWRDETWWLLWQPEEKDTVLVVYLGPEPSWT